MGAGKKESDGSFTGIVTGTSMEGGSQDTGLFGYKSGQRTIFLDANTGNATFGKAGVNQIKIEADGTGSIQGSGMTITLGLNPGISFTTKKFSVDKDGNLVAKSGTLGGWIIDTNELKSSNGNVHLNSDGSLSGPHWSIANTGVATFTDVIITNTQAGTAQKNIIAIGNNAGQGGGFTVNNSGQISATGATVTGTITANTLNASQGGKIGGWTIGSNSLSHGNFTLSASGSGSVVFGDGFTVNSSSVSKSNGKHSGSHSGTHTGSGGSGFGLNSGAGLLGNNLGDQYKWYSTGLLTDMDTKTISYIQSVKLVKDGDSYSLDVTAKTAMVPTSYSYLGGNSILMKKGS